VSDTDEKSLDLKEISDHFSHLLADGQVTEVKQLFAGLIDAFSQLRHRNNELELKLSQLLRRYVGRRSEKVAAGQLSFLLEKLAQVEGELQSDLNAFLLEKPKARPQKPRQKQKGHGRRPLPDPLPREVCVHDLEPAEKICSECGVSKELIGQESSMELEYVPAHFKVIEHLRNKYACRKCQMDVSRAKSAERVLPGSYAGAGLLSHLLVSKYVDHLPLHRVHQMYLRSEVDLPVSTLSDWVLSAARELNPIAQMIGREVLAAHLVQGDDTGLKVLQKGKGKGVNITKGHLWAYVGDSRYVAFAYTATREGKGPQAFLKDYEGWLQADAYPGYDALFDPLRKGKAIEVGCWAHTRRYYFDLLERDTRAAIPLTYIRELYEVEREADEKKLSAEQRLALRQQRDGPVLEKLAQWVAVAMKTEPPKSALYKAAQYTCNQWKALNRFLEDGRLLLDNTGCERALRVVAQGRKNYLFAGSEVAAHAAATFYTIFGTCTLCGVVPWTYLRDVMQKLCAGWPFRRLAELLPPVWAEHLAKQTDAG
jgi:transposase